MAIADNLLLNSELFKDLQILLVDNDRDTRDLYAFLLESYGATVTSLSSIRDTLDILNCHTPNLVICEMRFPGENIFPMIQYIRNLAQSSGIAIPILGISTCSQASLFQQFKVSVEAYLLKPVDIHNLVDEVWNLTLRPNIAYVPRIQERLAAHHPSEMMYFTA